jgi:hypothetical protein
MKRTSKPARKKVVNIATGSADESLPRTTRKAALARIGVTEEMLRTSPAITPMLEMASGGLKTVFAAMRFQQDANIAVFLARYDALPKGDRAVLPVEAIALAAGLDIRALFGSILVSLQAQSVSLVKVICLTGHPRIAEARMKYGKQPGGSKDRQAVDQALGLLPSPGGATFIGKAVYNSGKSTMDAQQQTRQIGGGEPDDDEDEGWSETDPDLDKIFPAANAAQQELVPIRQRTLPQDSSKGYKN